MSAFFTTVPYEGNPATTVTNLKDVCSVQRGENPAILALCGTSGCVLQQTRASMYLLVSTLPGGYRLNE